MSPDRGVSVPSMHGTKNGGAVRAVFLDVDGTYADHGVVPEGHVQAVRAARESGHRVLLCTGRPVSMLPQSIVGAGFDGVVASAGAYVEVGGDVLVDTRFPAELAARAITVLEANGAVYILEAPEALHTSTAAEQRLRAIIEAHFRNAPGGRASGSEAILAPLRVGEDLDSVRFAKISVFDSPVPMDRLIEEIGEGVDVVDNSIADEGRRSGEIFQRGISKADGIAAVMAHFGIARENTIAVGDGANDLEMIAFAGVGVVIEGSSAELLDIADHTAQPPREEGLVDAFAALGLT